MVELNQSAYTQKHLDALIDSKTKSLLLHSTWWERLFLTNYNWIYRAMHRQTVDSIRFGVGAEFRDIPKDARNRLLSDLGEKEDAL
jgi:hypothetical protein